MSRLTPAVLRWRDSEPYASTRKKWRRHASLRIILPHTTCSSEDRVEFNINVTSVIWHISNILFSVHAVVVRLSFNFKQARIPSRVNIKMRPVWLWGRKNHSLETMSANKLVNIHVCTHTNFGINPTYSICVMTKTTTNQPTNTLLVIESMITRSTTTACEQ